MIIETNRKMMIDLIETNNHLEETNHHLLHQIINNKINKDLVHMENLKKRTKNKINNWKKIKKNVKNNKKEIKKN